MSRPLVTLDIWVSFDVFTSDPSCVNIMVMTFCQISYKSDDCAFRHLYKLTGTIAAVVPVKLQRNIYISCDIFLQQIKQYCSTNVSVIETCPGSCHGQCPVHWNWQAKQREYTHQDHMTRDDHVITVMAINMKFLLTLYDQVVVHQKLHMVISWC